MLSDRALDPDTLFGRLGLHRQAALIVGVSGGSDSLALLFLLHDWLKAQGRELALRAVTVDHRLREGSAQEAAFVAQLCAARGVTHRIEAWREPKPATGISAAARSARYRLLLHQADAAGAEIILTAHTADDQVETVAMRRERGQGLGLAGMAEETLIENRVWLLRPLLGVARADLRRYLEARGLSWIDDPSNANMAFERVRLRGSLSQADRAELLALARDWALQRRDLALRGAALLHPYRPGEAGTLSLDDAFLHARDEAAVLHSLRHGLAFVGRREHLPELEAAMRVLQSLQAGERGGSLGGCVISRRGTRLVIRPERRGSHARMEDPPAVPPPARRIVAGFDLPLVGEIARLAGAVPLPDPPSSHHKGTLP